MNRGLIPVSDKYVLTATEAANYFCVGEKKLRQLVENNRDADWILYNGNRLLIKRKAFEKFLDATNVV